MNGKRMDSLKLTGISLAIGLLTACQNQKPSSLVTLQETQNLAGPTAKVVTDKSILYGHPFILNFETDELCSGTLIHERIVLTAAHCIKEPGLYGVGFGDDATDRENTYWVIPAKLHPFGNHMSPNDGYDLGLIILPENAFEKRPDILEQARAHLSRLSFRLTAEIVIKRLEPFFMKFPGPLRVIGWGLQTYSSATGYQGWDGLLRLADMDDFKVGSYYISFNVSGKPQQNYTCYGDSGGPIYYVNPNAPDQRNWELMGVISGLMFDKGKPVVCGAPNVITHASAFTGIVNLIFVADAAAKAGINLKEVYPELQPLP